MCALGFHSKDVVVELGGFGGKGIVLQLLSRVGEHGEADARTTRI